jgi:hypothetical protein
MDPAEPRRQYYGAWDAVAADQASRLKDEEAAVTAPSISAEEAVVTAPSIKAPEEQREVPSVGRGGLPSSYQGLGSLFKIARIQGGESVPRGENRVLFGILEGIRPSPQR